MSWQRQEIVTPIPEAIEAAVSPVSGLISTISPILSTISAALNVAKIFLTGTIDPFKAAAEVLLIELENLNNDLFGTGVFVLTVSAFDIEGVTRYDPVFKGFPLITPANAISAAVQSFDDQGDPDRPQFSKDAVVTAFGILATANSLDQFKSLIDQLIAVFAIPDWTFMSKEITRYQTTTFPSVKPDWKSLRLNSIDHLSEIQKSINLLIATLRGYLTVADNNIQQLIDIIALKVSRLQQILNDINTLINNISKANGLFFLDVPPALGGNEYLKLQLRDSFLESPCLNNGYTMLTLFVGGGASAAPVNTIRQIIV